MKNRLFLLVVFGLISACETGPEVLSNIELPTCDMLTIPEPCDPEGNAKAPVITFNKNTLVVAPRNVCADRDATIEFRITPASGDKNPPGSVAIIAKNGEDTWLIGSNSLDSKEIVIKVPGYVPPNTPHDYTIVSIMDGNISCVDPRVHVQD
jgi:hypothetical protein